MKSITFETQRAVSSKAAQAAAGAAKIGDLNIADWEQRLTGIDTKITAEASARITLQGAAADWSVSLATAAVPDGAGTADQIIVAAWAPDAEKELRKIPFFVRGKARRNTERYAIDRGVPLITIETLYDAKAHFSR